MNTHARENGRATKIAKPRARRECSARIGERYNLLATSLHHATFVAVISARGLTKIFKDKKRGKIRAVDNVSFTCKPGEIYGLLGVNGAGKTTTLRLLATMLKPSEGTAEIAGHDIVNAPEQVRAQIGFLSTATALYGRLTAREFIAYFARLNAMPEDRLAPRIDSLIQTLSIADFANVRCDKLSTGMKQRVSIARSVVHDPPVMIFDEPTLGLDVLSSRDIVQFIRQCRAQGKTVIFSSHVMSEVEKLCDRIGIIHNGQLLREGTLAQLCAQSHQTDLEEIFVQTVMGSPSSAAARPQASIN
jgi:sodium transport system ATP-binding protein